MNIASTVTEIRDLRRQLQGTVGVVPTMGALHEGHLTLVRQARERCSSVLVTIFVNPTQFAANEDFSSYPRDLDRDLRMLDEIGVDGVFTPTPSIMYPNGFQTCVEVENITQGLEGSIRPGHFRGVTTVVSKLFNLTQPDYAFFGQKDAQQVAVIRRMVYDLNIPVEIIVTPTQREDDGLAMSSRNVYLTSEQRAAAPLLYQALRLAGEHYQQGERSPDKLQAAVNSQLVSASLIVPQYISVTNARTLTEITHETDEPLLVSVAARLGNTRLIDNLLLPETFNTTEGLTALLGNPSS